MYYFDWTYAPWSDIDNETVITEENVTSFDVNNGRIRGHMGVFTFTPVKSVVYKTGGIKWKVLLSCDVSEADCAGTLLYVRGTLHDAIKATEKLILSKPMPKSLL